VVGTLIASLANNIPSLGFCNFSYAMANAFIKQLAYEKNIDNNTLIDLHLLQIELEAHYARRF